MMEMISGWFKSGTKGLEWVILEMDITQWGIVSVIFVVLGFMALRTRL